MFNHHVQWRCEVRSWVFTTIFRIDEQHLLFGNPTWQGKILPFHVSLGTASYGSGTPKQLWCFRGSSDVHLDKAISCFSKFKGASYLIHHQWFLIKHPALVRHHINHINHISHHHPKWFHDDPWVPLVRHHINHPRHTSGLPITAILFPRPHLRESGWAVWSYNVLFYWDLRPKK